jgi:hypothetical protein
MMPMHRYTIGAACGAVMLGAMYAAGQNNDVNVQFHAFQDARGVTVLSPTADLSKDFTERTNLRVNFGMDAISAASDSCVRCHRDGVNSRREAGGLTVTQKFNAVKWSMGGAFSKEDFYRATTATTSLLRDLAGGNTTVAGGYTFSLNQPTLHPTPQIENQYQHGAFASLTQTLSRGTITQVGYELARIVGYQDNPFLRAHVNGVMVLGHVPDSRTRNTVSARIRQALPADTFLEADYRRYFDSWDVRSNTLSVGISHRFVPQLLVGATYRRYDQTAASFYAPDYVGPAPQYFTADFRLEPFSSNLYTGKLTWTPHGGLLWLREGTGLTLQYDRYDASNGFQAAIVSAGVRVPLSRK